MGKKYANPPIVEAICEFYISPDSKWDITIPGLVFEKLRNEFPNKEQRIVQEVEMQRQPPNNIQQIIRLDERVIFFSDDRKTFVQIGNRLLSINHLKPYTSWSEFKTKIECAFNAFCNSTEIKGLQRIGLRYINHVEIIGKQIKLEDYFNFRPFLGGELPKNIISFIVGCLIPSSDSRDLCKLEISDAMPNKEGNKSFLLDLYYYLNQPLAIPINEVLDWVELAHQNIEKIFEACITDQLREYFNKEIE